jgi:hypothetical protein
MPAAKFDFKTILRTLNKHGVDYIVIGGVCATLHGAPVFTFDLDIVYSRGADNLARLETALLELNAYYRGHPPHRIIPQAERLDTPGHHLLATSAGPLDMLGSVTEQRGYAELLPHTVTITLDDEFEITMVTLPMLITLKTETGRPKDKQTLPVLQQTLKEIEAAQQTQEDDQAT